MNGLMPEAPLRLTPKGRRRGRSYTRPHRLPLGVPARPLRPPVPRGARPTLAPSVALPSFRGRLMPPAPRSKRARWGFEEKGRQKMELIYVKTLGTSGGEKVLTK